VMSIAVLTGYDSIEKLTPSKPDVVVASLHELLRLLQYPGDRSLPDAIRIHGLEVQARIGVPDEERARPQKLVLDVVLESDFRGLVDDISRTTDYAAVAEWLRSQCASREVRLLETLAQELTAGLLENFPQISATSVEIRKFILPGTKDVSVRIRRERD